MTYPPAPWTLQGYAIQTLQPVDIERSRAFVPPELEIVSVLPGKTLGGVYLSAYESGSLLEYNELIVSAATVRYQGKVGSWISHIYVDNDDSVAGGREIWELPKEMAEFTWDTDRVSVRQNGRQLCHLRYKKGLFSFSSWWRQQFSGDCFSGLKSDLLLFKGQFEAKIGLVKGSLEIPTESPFAALGLGQPWLTLNLRQLQLIAGVPEVVGSKVPQLSYR